MHSKLAEVAAQEGDTDAAEEHLRKCLAAAEACEDKAAQAACHQQLANLAQSAGDFSAALELQQRFLDLSAGVRLDSLAHDRCSTALHATAARRFVS